MWKQVIDWCLQFLSKINEFCDFLFTPVNINMLAEANLDLNKELNRLGLTNWPVFLQELLANASEPLYVTPISIISIGTIVTLVAIFFIKKVVF